ncbi:hypothetical protein J2127_001062 [Methanococcus voltae]|uniref:MAG6450 family protein n=1 Tax=Methanococcus voltae TaxID=2188 RepID=UPI001AE7A8D4|nr:hypothetical protein [Methanococcus voltae]MBP2143893.1 hypothetical protein [Methanococcus voltae]
MYELSKKELKNLEKFNRYINNLEKLDANFFSKSYFVEKYDPRLHFSRIEYKDLIIDAIIMNQIVYPIQIFKNVKKMDELSSDKNIQKLSSNFKSKKCDFCISLKYYENNLENHISSKDIKKLKGESLSKLSKEDLKLFESFVSNVAYGHKYSRFSPTDSDIKYKINNNSENENVYHLRAKQSKPFRLHGFKRKNIFKLLKLDPKHKTNICK